MCNLPHILQSHRLFFSIPHNIPCYDRSGMRHFQPSPQPLLPDYDMMEYPGLSQCGDSDVTVDIGDAVGCGCCGGTDGNT
jgi:hypothetical protein